MPGGVAIPGGVAGLAMGVSGSPCRSAASDGDKPELELDMWEGQFSLSSDNIHGLALDDMDELVAVNNGINHDIMTSSATKWRTDSSVTCTTVS